jgi:DNA-binding NtrC family response regulator
VVCITLPALRERDEDIVMLVRHFLKSFGKENSVEPPTLSADSLDLLKRYSWPGNVRELEACVVNACLFCDGGELLPQHFSHKQELLDAVSEGHGAGTGGGTTLLLAEGQTLSQLEEQAILVALQRSNGNKVSAAKELGITRQTLYNKLKVYGIEVTRDIRRT